MDRRSEKQRHVDQAQRTYYKKSNNGKDGNSFVVRACVLISAQFMPLASCLTLRFTFKWNSGMLATEGAFCTFFLRFKQMANKYTV